MDEEQGLLYYIFLQYLPRKQIEFDSSFLPEGYTYNGELEELGSE